MYIAKPHTDACTAWSCIINAYAVMVYIHTQLCLRIYININGLGSNINMLQQTCTAHTEHIVYFNINIHLCMNITFLLLIVSSVPIEPMPLPNCDHTATSLP